VDKLAGRPLVTRALVQVRSTAAERARRDLVARVALEERIRVAQEVHDVAGHGFAAVAMQAGVVLLVLGERPDQARRSLEAIRATSTQALTELRAALDAFHPPGEARPVVASSAAAPGADEVGLGSLHALLDHVQAGGLVRSTCRSTAPASPCRRRSAPLPTE
jgi:histidine kinase